MIHMNKLILIDHEIKQNDPFQLAKELKRNGTCNLTVSNSKDSFTLRISSPFPKMIEIRADFGHIIFRVNEKKKVASLSSGYSGTTFYALQVEDIYKDGFRGLGSTLTDIGFTYLKEQGYKRFEIMGDNTVHNGISFYDKWGFKKSFFNKDKLVLKANKFTPIDHQIIKTSNKSIRTLPTTEALMFNKSL